MLKIGILSRYCSLYELLSQAQAFDAAKALSAAKQVAQNPASKEMLDEIQEIYESFVVQISKLPKFGLPAGPAKAIVEFKNDALEAVADIERLEANNPDLDYIEFYTRSALQVILQEYGEFDFVRSLEPDLPLQPGEETLPQTLEEQIQTEREEAAQTPTAKETSRMEGGFSTKVETGAHSKAYKEKKRRGRPEERRVTPSAVTIRKLPTETDIARFEERFRHNKELARSRALRFALNRVSQMKIPDAEKNKLAKQIAKEYEQQLVDELIRTGPWYPDELLLWEKSSIAAKDLVSKEDPHKEDPYSTSRVSFYTYSIYKQNGGREFDFKAREKLQTKLRREKEIMIDPSFLEQERERLEAIPKSKEELAARLRKHYWAGRQEEKKEYETQKKEREKSKSTREWLRKFRGQVADDLIY